MTGQKRMHSAGPSRNADERFKKVFRDNVILSDPELRPVYDRMLEFEHQQHQQPSVAHNVPDAIVVLVLAIVMAGVYALYTNLPEISAYLPKISIAKVAADAAREPSAVVAQPSPPVEVDISDRAYDKSENANIPSVALSSAATPEAAHAPVNFAAPSLPAADANASANDRGKDATTSVPGAVAPAANGGDATGKAAFAPSAVTPSTTVTAAKQNPSSASHGSAPIKDATFYRDQGIESYRNGDLPVAITNFDRAIQLDPNFEEVYIDRGIALYRLRKLDRAFADVAQAIRIQNSHRAATTPLP